MFPRFHRSPLPAGTHASPARGDIPAATGPHLATGGATTISRVPRFAAASGRPARPEAPGDERGALCDTLTELVDTLAARGKDPRPPTPRAAVSGDGPPPVRTPFRRAGTMPA